MKNRLQFATEAAGRATHAAGRFIVRNRVPIANGLLFLSGFIRTLEPSATRAIQLIELASSITEPVAKPRRNKKRL